VRNTEKLLQNIYSNCYNFHVSCGTRLKKYSVLKSVHKNNFRQEEEICSVVFWTIFL